MNNTLFENKMIISSLLSLYFYRKKGVMQHMQGMYENSETHGISLPPYVWRAIDNEREDLPRSIYLRKLLQRVFDIEVSHNNKNKIEPLEVIRKISSRVNKNVSARNT
jgi:hypothetical protein